MRHSILPHDLTAEFRAVQAARRRNRSLAVAGLLCFCVTLGILLGSVCVADWPTAAIILICAWGVLGMRHLLTRH